MNNMIAPFAQNVPILFELARTGMTNLSRCLPMIDEKKIPEFLETSLIYMLSAIVAGLGFLLVWIVCSLAGLGT